MNSIKKLTPKKFNTYLLYTLLFCLISAVFYHYFSSQGHSLIWKKDGVWQHYCSYQYSYRYIKSIFDAIVHKAALNTPMVNFTLGQGLDTLTTLNCYDFVDPICILSIVIFQSSLVTGYAFMVFAKLYLAGLAFCILFSSSVSDDRSGSLVECGLPPKVDDESGSIFAKAYNPCFIVSAALMYTFCGFATYCSVRHPNFMSGMYCLPLMILATEKIIAGKKGLMLSLVVALAFVSNYYTTYMISIVWGIWMIVRQFSGKKDSKQSLRHFLNIATSYILGVGLSAVVTLPSIYAFLHNGRAGIITGYTDSFLVYPKEFYRSFVEYAVSGYMDNDYWSLLNYAPILIAGLCLVFLMKGNRKIKSMIAIMLVFQLVPIFGLVMNGFGYVSNRWNYALALFLCIGFVTAQDELLQLSFGKTFAITGIFGAWAACCILDEEYKNCNNLPYLIAGITVLALWGICLANRISKRVKSARNIVESNPLTANSDNTTHNSVINDCKNNPSTESRNVDRLENSSFCYAVLSFAILLLTVVSLLINIHLRLHSDYQGYAENFVDAENPDTWKDESIADMANSADAVSFSRIDMCEDKRNSTSSANVNGTGAYWSILPSEIASFSQELQLNKHENTCTLYGMDSRTALESLASVKYYTAKERNAAMVPYGFVQVADRVYENINWLPVVYAYDSYISQDTYDQLSALEKQQSMLQGAVVSEKEAKKIDVDSYANEITPEPRMAKINWELVALDGIDLASNTNTMIGSDEQIAADESVSHPGEETIIENDGNSPDNLYTITSNEEGASLLCRVEVSEPSELYLWIDGVQLEKPNKTLLIDINRGVYDGEDNQPTDIEEAGNDVESKNSGESYKDDTSQNSDELYKGNVSIINPEDIDWQINNEITVENSLSSWYLPIDGRNACLGYCEPGVYYISIEFDRACSITFDSMGFYQNPMNLYDQDIAKLRSHSYDNFSISNNKIDGTVDCEKPSLLNISVPYSKGWTAYVDGVKTPIIHSNVMYMLLPIEAGSHSIELRYCTPWLKVGTILSLVSLAGIMWMEWGAMAHIGGKWRKPFTV